MRPCNVAHSHFATRTRQVDFEVERRRLPHAAVTRGVPKDKRFNHQWRHALAVGGLDAIAYIQRNCLQEVHAVTRKRCVWDDPYWIVRQPNGVNLRLFRFSSQSLLLKFRHNSSAKVVQRSETIEQDRVVVAGRRPNTCTDSLEIRFGCTESD